MKYLKLTVKAFLIRRFDIICCSVLSKNKELRIDLDVIQISSSGCSSKRGDNFTGCSLRGISTFHRLESYYVALFEIF